MIIIYMELVMTYMMSHVYDETLPVVQLLLSEIDYYTLYR